MKYDFTIIMPLIGLPAIILFIDYGISNIKKRRVDNSVNRLLVIVLLICLMIFSLAASKLILYVLPLYLFIAIVAAKHLLVISSARSRLLLNIITGFFVVLFTVLLFGALFLYSIVLPVWPVSMLSVTSIICLLLIRSGDKITEFIRAPLNAAIGMAFFVAILPAIAKQNELTINSIKPIAKFITDDSRNRTKTLIIYNQFLPSLEFYTNKIIVTVYNGNWRTEREIQFENEARIYMNSYFRLPGDSTRLRLFTEQHDIIVVAKKTDPVPDSLYFLKNKNGKLLFKGNWVIDMSH